MLPAIRRNILEPLWVLRNGSPLLRHWAALEKSQYLSEEELRSKQWQRTKAMVEHAITHSGFYRERLNDHGVKHSDLQSPDDMRKLPILKKEDIRNNYDTLICDQFRQEELMNFRTGGSTGTSLDIYITEECSELRNAAARRHDRWSGWEVGEPRAAVWVDFRGKDLKSRLMSFLLDPRIHLSPLNLNKASVMTFATEWAKVRPTLLLGHAHALYQLAEYIERYNIQEIQPRSIISTVMTLMPHERATIERVFGVKVFDRYGCEEVSLIASECEQHHGMHLNIDHLFIEFIDEDGAAVAPGQQGNIIVTDLINAAMPLIRYQVGDVGVPSGRTCSCGRGLPLMEHITGRSADFLVRKDGSLVAGISLLDKTLLMVSGIKQMQIIQENIEYFLLKIVTDPAYGPGSERLLRDQMAKEFGNNVNIDIDYVDRIEAEKSGKYRFSISKVKNRFM